MSTFEQIGPTSKGDISDTASLMSLKGIVSGPAREGAEQFVSILKQLETLPALNGSVEVSKGFLDTSSTVNTGLSVERGRMTFYFCLTMVGVAMLVLASAAIALTGTFWATRVGLGGASAALGGVEFKILTLLLKARNQISSDHHRLTETMHKAKNHSEDMARRERAILLHAHVLMNNPEAAGPLADLIQRLYGSQAK